VKKKKKVVVPLALKLEFQFCSMKFFSINGHDTRVIHIGCDLTVLVVVKYQE
jgi:hypothetical protein